jgi:hypothetical protein
MGHPQDLSLSEQCCDMCGISFFFLESKDGDCSTQEVTFCPGCGGSRTQAAAPATTPTEPELAEARLSIPAHHDDDDRLWLAAEEKRLAALVLSRVNHAWLASATPRPDLIAVSEKTWGVRFDGQMVCAPTIEEAVTVLRSGLAAHDKPPALRQKAIEFTEQWFNRKFVTPKPHQYTDLMHKMVERLVGTFAAQPSGAQGEGPVTSKMMSKVFAETVNNANPAHEHIYDHRLGAKILNRLLAAAPAQPSGAQGPGGKGPLSLYKACETIAEKEIEKWGWHSEGARAAHNIWSEIRTLAASEAAAPGGKEPSGSNSPKYMQMGSITSVVDPQHRTMVAGFPPPPNIIEIPEYLDKVAKEIAEEFCGGSEAVEDAILAKLLATHPSQDKPPAAPLCGKRIPETGLGCTLEPGHQGRHDVDVTKVSEAPLRKRLEGVLPSIAIRIHAYMSAAQSLPYEEGETCEECEDIARELIELDGEPPNEAGQVISQEPIKIELRSLEEATESVSKWPAWKREYSEQHPFLTSQDPKSESTMSMQKACETIAEKEIKKWYSHSEGARAAHNIWSKIRALAARPKEEPK